MNAWFLEDFLADLGLAVLHSVWQVALLALLLWSLLTLLHRASPRSRYPLALLALATSLAWPTATFHQARAARIETRRVLTLGPGAPSPGAPPRAAPLRPALPFLATAWALGVLALSLRLGGGWVWLRRLRHATTPVPEALRRRAEGLAARMRVAMPELRVSEAHGPFAYGFFRTVVVLPAAALARLDASALEAVLAHEFAHLRRSDFLVNALQTLADALLFHHPAARWISGAARLERERCCDADAAAACGDARTVASALLSLDGLEPPALVLAARGTPLFTRVQHLLGRSSRPSLAASIGATLLLGGLALGAMPLWRLPAPQPIQAPAALVRLADAIAATEGVDPHLVRAVIQCESGFVNRTAPNAMGSVGLMQLIPATAARFGVADARDPAQNVRGGVRYLRFLLDRYAGDTARAVMAYNAGEEAVDRSVDRAPTEESRAYTLAVMALYRSRGVRAR